MSLDPLRLRLLVSLAELGTVRAVAQQLSMSPSAVSQQLSVLEREAKVPILDRHGRRLVLTLAGSRLVAHGRDILDRIDEAERDLAELGSEPVGPVRIAAFSSALSSLLIPALPALATAYPRLEPIAVEMEPHESLPELRRGGCDLAVVADFAEGATPIDEDLLVVPLTTDPLVLVKPLDLPNHGLADMAEQPWVLDSAIGYLSGLVTTLCRRAGFEPTVVGRYQSYSLLLQQVEAGRAVTVLPRLAVDPRYRVATQVLDPVVSRQISLAMRTSARSRPSVKAVVDFMVDRVRER